MVWQQQNWRIDLKVLLDNGSYWVAHPPRGMRQPDRTARTFAAVDARLAQACSTFEPLICPVLML